MTTEAIRLLEQPTPKAGELPRRIEELNLAAHDTLDAVRDLQDEASTESNETKRKNRKAEILRDNASYQEICREIRLEQRNYVRLTERAHRHARELRLYIAEKGAQL